MASLERAPRDALISASSVAVNSFRAKEVGHMAFVAHANADLISILDLESWEPKGTLTAGKEPDGMACSPIAAGRKHAPSRRQP